mmetsp:Transcript_47341/g.110728  ORF Transcript_47341/g.110728 Transcript_47341/m.110728 type:complete len:316 (-) Transcript_47341:49-996(-)
MADPRAADVQHAILALWCLRELRGIEISNGLNGIIIDVRHKPRLVVEAAVVALVLPAEVCLLVRPARRPRPLRLHKGLAHGAVCNGERHLDFLPLPAGEVHALDHVPEADQLNLELELLAGQGVIHVEHGRTIGQDLLHPRRNLLCSAASQHNLHAFLQAFWYLRGRDVHDKGIGALSVGILRGDGESLTLADLQALDGLVKTSNNLPGADGKAKRIFAFRSVEDAVILCQSALVLHEDLVALLRLTRSRHGHSADARAELSRTCGVGHGPNSRSHRPENRGRTAGRRNRSADATRSRLGHHLPCQESRAQSASR